MDIGLFPTKYVQSHVRNNAKCPPYILFHEEIIVSVIIQGNFKKYRNEIFFLKILKMDIDLFPTKLV